MRFSLRALFVFITAMCVVALLAGSSFQPLGSGSLSSFVILVVILSPLVALSISPFVSSRVMSFEAKMLGAGLFVLIVAAISPAVFVQIEGPPASLCFFTILVVIVAIMLAAVVVDELHRGRDD